MKKTLAILLSATMMLGVLSGCGNTTTPQNPEQTEKTNIVVYTSESQDLVTDMLDDFVAKNPDITYTLFRSGTGKVTAKIDTELATGSTEADVIWVADLGYLYQLDGKGLIEHYTPAAASAIDSKFNYNDGMALEVRQIFNIIAYNTLSCKVSLSDWDDLANAELKGKVAMANPSYSGGALTTVATHVSNQNIGWKLYDALKANDLKLEESNGNLQTKVASGEYTAVSIVDFMARNAAAEGSPVASVWPESGAVMVPTPIALISGQDEKVTAACQRLLEYLLSDDAQKLFVAQGYIPVSTTVGVPEGAPEVKDIVTCPLDLDFFVNHTSEVRDRFAALFA